MANLEHWKFKVNILKDKLQICETNNQINEEIYIDPSISHISTNTDETKFNMNNKIDTPEVHININRDEIKFNINDKIDTPEVLENSNKKNTEQYDDKLNNESDSIHSDYDNDMDESIEIENEDESNLDPNLVQTLSTIDNNIAINLDREILSTNSDQILISEKIDKANTISQKNTLKPISEKKLENESSTECSLESCVKELEQNIVTEYSSDNINISPMSTQDSLLQKTQQLPNVDNSIKELTNNISPKNNNSDISLEDNNNNNTEEFILNSSYQQKNTQQLPSEEEKINVFIKESPPSNIVLQKSNIVVNLKDNNDDTEQFNVDVTQKKKSDSESLIVETNENIIKESINTLAQKISNIEVAVHKNNNNTQELSMNSSYQQKSEEIQTSPQLPSVEEKTDVSINESASNISLNISNPIVNNNDTEQPYKTQKEYTNSDSLQNNTEADYQQVNNNYIESPLLEKEKVEINNENGISNKNVMPIGDNLKDNNNTTKINEFINQPDSQTQGDLPELSDDHKKPESLNSLRDNLPNVGSKVLNNDLADGNIINFSSLQELNVVTEIVPSNDYKTTVVDELDVTEILNEKPIDQCTSNECFQSIDSTPKYGYESIQHQYKSESKGLPTEIIHKTVEYNNNKQLKEFVPKSFVASFGHPDACSGVNCLNFKRNVEKTIKSPQPLNPVPKHLHHDEISSSINIDTKKEKENIIIEETKQSGLELSFLDHFQNWLSSPTTNTIDFFVNIFDENSKEYNGE